MTLIRGVNGPLQVNMERDGRTLWEADDEDEVDEEESDQIRADHLVDHHHERTHDLKTSSKTKTKNKTKKMNALGLPTFNLKMTLILQGWDKIVIAPN